MKDPGLITRYQTGVANTKGTKSVALTDRMKKTAKTKIDVTQVGSDTSFNRELGNSVLRISFLKLVICI